MTLRTASPGNSLKKQGFSFLSLHVCDGNEEDDFVSDILASFSLTEKAASILLRDSSLAWISLDRDLHKEVIQLSKNMYTMY